MAAPAEPRSRRPSALMRFLRYGLPLVICASGIVIGFALGWDETGIEAAVAMFAAGSSLWLMNFLWRIGIVGDRDRDEEDAARAYFDEHGRWPDDERRAPAR